MLGAISAFAFTFFILPYIVVNPYFESFQFIKDFKQGKIIINQKESVYIQENAAIENAVQKVQKSIVAIQSPSLGLKSGLIVTSDGLVVTVANAIPANRNVSVFVAGELVDFNVVKIDYKNNLALVKIDKDNLQTVGFAGLDKIHLGAAVFLTAPTSIKQDNWLANSGIIREIDQDSITTNISEKPVVAGSPLFNSASELIGINFINSEGKISAVPVDRIQTLLGL